MDFYGRKITFQQAVNGGHISHHTLSFFHSVLTCPCIVSEREPQMECSSISHAQSSRFTELRGRGLVIEVLSLIELVIITQDKSMPLMFTFTRAQWVETLSDIKNVG